MTEHEYTDEDVRKAQETALAVGEKVMVNTIYAFMGYRETDD